MSTVDDAFEAGARAVLGLSPLVYDNQPGTVTVTAITAAWPVLLAGLREMHMDHECTDWRKCSIIFSGRCVKAGHCADCGYAMPCPTIRELDRIDRELGIKHQSGEPESGV